MSKVGPEVEFDVMETYRETGSIRKAAAFARCSFWTAKRIIRESDRTAEESIARQETDSESTLSWVSDQPVKTLEDAVAYAKVDLSIWRVDRWECTGWTTTLKVEDDKGKKVPVKKQQWRVKLCLKRILKPADAATLDAIVAKVAKGLAPLSPFPRIALPNENVRTGPHLCVLDLVDCHFGKLAWAPETGSNYDLAIAERVYRNAVAELVRMSSGFNVEEYLIPLGSDFFHVDNTAGNTTAGTPQDVDGRLHKIIATGIAAVVHAVDLLASLGPRVVIKWVPGNHDWLTSMMLTQVIKHHFLNCPNVTVDDGPNPRKYHEYGATLIGLTHGNEEKHSGLPLNMATEQPQAWARTKCREFHVGHWHKAKQQVFIPLDDHGGVWVRTLMSLSGADAWHARKGWTGSRKAAEAFLYSKTGGYVAAFCVEARTETKGAA